MEAWDDDVFYLVLIPALLLVIAVFGVVAERLLRRRRHARRRAYHGRSRHPQPGSDPRLPLSRSPAARRPAQQPAPPDLLPTVPGGL